MTMIEPDDAARVVRTVVKELTGVVGNSSNFKGLPDTFWGYFAKGHDGRGAFAVIVTYSEKGSDVDDLIQMYEQWVTKNKAAK
jgi:hypothetical protein